VTAVILTDFPEHCTRLEQAWLWDGTHLPRRVGVRSCWLHKNRAIFHFEGCESIGNAEQLVGLEVQVPLAERMPLPAGRYYVTDLMGCGVWEEGAAERLGTVCDVQLLGREVPGTPLLVLETAQGELLIPLAEEICRHIDLAGRRIDVVLPGDLRELNRKT